MRVAMIAAIAAMFAATSAMAQESCTLKWTTKLYYKGKLDAENVRVYYDLDKKELDYLNKAGQKVLDASSKDQDKKGPYTLVLGDETVCDGKVVKSQLPAEISLEGLTIRGVNRFVRASAKMDVAHADDNDKKQDKGKRRAWGKD